MAKNIFEQYAQEEKKKKALSEREPSNVFEQYAQEDRRQDDEQVPSNVFEQFKQQEQAQAQPPQNVFEQYAQEEKKENAFEQPEESYEQPGRQQIPQTVIPRATNFLAPEEKERFGQAAKRGLDRSFFAKLAGSKPSAPPNDENWLEHLTSTMAELAGDYLLIAGGAKLGAMAGSPGGLMGSGVTTAIGAFMLPAAMKSALGEYEDWIKQGNDGSFRDFLDRAARVGKETAKAGAMGAIVGNIGRFLPFLDKIPGMKKVLNTNWGKAATIGAAETTGLTLAEAAVNLEAPTWKRLRDNALMIAAVHGAHKIAGNVPPLFRGKGKTPVEPAKPKTEKPFEQEAKVEPVKPKGESASDIERFKPKVTEPISEIERFKPKEEIESVRKIRPKEVEIAREFEPTEKISKPIEKLIEKPTERVSKPIEELVKEKPYDKELPFKEKTYGKDTLTEDVKSTINENPTLEKLAQINPEKFANAITKKEFTPKDYEYFKTLEDRIGIKETERFKDVYKLKKTVEAVEEAINRKLTERELDRVTTHRDAVYKSSKQKIIKAMPEPIKRIREIRNKNFKAEKAIENKQQEMKVYEQPSKQPPRTPYEQATNQVKESVNILTSAKNKLPLSKKISKYIPKQALKTIGAKDLNIREREYFGWVEENIGERDAKIVESQFKWNKELATIQKELGRKMTKQEANDTIYYRQRTGNPKIKGDTFEALNKRLPDPLKKSIQTEIDSHFRATKKALNDNPLMKDIREREGLADTYLTGMYKYDAKKFAKAETILQKQFRTANEFANTKEFTTFVEAFEKAGLEPLYDNIYDAMRLYDKRVIERVQNAELIDQISKYQNENNVMLIRVPKDVTEFNRMEAQGFEPFYDRYLRDKFARVDAEGVKPETLTEFPAMVDPDLAQAMQGIFKRTIGDKISPIAKGYDKLGNFLKQKNVYGSFFHYLPLSTSAMATPLGWRYLNPMWLRRGKQFRGDINFMKDAARYGLGVDIPKDFQAYETSTKVLDKVHDWVKDHAGTTATLPIKLLRQVNRMFGYMFTYFHPRLKAVVWDEYNKYVTDALMKAGETITPARVAEIKRGTAKLTNNLLGGQKVETIPGLNNPKNMRNLRRAMAYPDWNISSLRQFLLAFKTPEYLAKLERTTAGKKAMVSLGKKYWFKYGINAVAITAAGKYLLNGWEQTDKKASITGLRFNFKKAWEGLTGGDPSKLSSFPLPDVPVKVPGINYTFNMGRDKEGRRVYGRIGKQFWENLGWMQHPVKTAYGKGNPVITTIAKHALGITPTDDGWFNIRGKYQGNVKKSWDATEPFSAGRLISHAKELTRDLIAPYSFSTIEKKGVAPWLLTGLGMIPLSQGISPYSAGPLIKKALQKKDNKSLNMIVKFLKGNKYKNSEIQRKITTIRNELRKR